MMPLTTYREHMSCFSCCDVELRELHVLNWMNTAREVLNSSLTPYTLRCSRSSRARLTPTPGPRHVPCSLLWTLFAGRPRGGGSSRLAHPSKVAPRDAVLLYLHDALTLSGLAAH